MKETLERRVRLFERLELPGQPHMMHMGTAYLVSDLWREIQRLRKELPAHIAIDREGQEPS